MSTLKVAFLNLPKPPVALATQLINCCQQIPLFEEHRIWVDNFHRNEIPVAAHEYGTKDTALSAEIQNQVREVYQKFFPNTTVSAVVGKIKNVLAVPSQSPPHCDRARYVAINYLLELGGPDVLTVFYKESRHNPDLSSAANIYHKDVTVDFKTVIPLHQWHAYDVQHYHSVENIISERYLFSLLLDTNPTFADFRQRYENLIDTDHSIQT